MIAPGVERRHHPLPIRAEPGHLPTIPRSNSLGEASNNHWWNNGPNFTLPAVDHAASQSRILSVSHPDQYALTANAPVLPSPSVNSSAYTPLLSPASSVLTASTPGTSASNRCYGSGEWVVPFATQSHPPRPSPLTPGVQPGPAPSAGLSEAQNYFEPRRRSSSGSFEANCRSMTLQAVSVLREVTEQIWSVADGGDSNTWEERSSLERRIDHAVAELKASFFRYGLGISGNDTQAMVRKRHGSVSTVHNPSPPKSAKREPHPSIPSFIEPHPPLVQSQSSPVVPTASTVPNLRQAHPRKSVSSVALTGLHFVDHMGPGLGSTPSSPRCISTTPNSPEVRGFPGSGPASPEELSFMGNQLQVVPVDLKVQMDTVFENFLQKLCSHLSMTDSKGETIHQTLMAKKMQRLDESGDFRLFKFRIQAFTNRFAEELQADSLGEDVLPLRLVRQYLWQQPLVSRYNEEGKKSKSKGNHVWTIDARRVGDKRWEFRPFERKIVLPSQRNIRAGAHWSWEPRVWDPQLPYVRADFSSPPGGIPDWLSWKRVGEDEDSYYWVLSGTPPVHFGVQDESITLHVVAEAEPQHPQDPKERLTLQFELQSQTRLNDSGASSSSATQKEASRPSVARATSSRVRSPSSSAGTPSAPPPHPVLSGVVAAPSATPAAVAPPESVAQAPATVMSAPVISAPMPIVSIPSIGLSPTPQAQEVMISRMLDPCNLLIQEQVVQTATDTMGPIQKALTATINAEQALMDSPRKSQELVNAVQIAHGELQNAVVQSQNAVIVAVQQDVATAAALSGIDPAAAAATLMPVDGAMEDIGLSAPPDSELEANATVSVEMLEGLAPMTTG